MKKAIGGVILVILVAGAAFWYWEARASSKMTFRYEEVTRGKLVATVGSTGTLQAQDAIDVGAQVQGRIIYIGEDKHPMICTTNGTTTVTTASTAKLSIGQVVIGPNIPENTLIASVGPSTGTFTMSNAAKSSETLELTISATRSGFVDWGSEVEGPVKDKDGKIIKLGTLLAQIDPSLYAAQRRRQQGCSWGPLLPPSSPPRRTWPSRPQPRIWLAWTFGRATTLIDTNGIAKAEYDQFNANNKSAMANLKVSKANLESARAQKGVGRRQPENRADEPRLHHDFRTGQRQGDRPAR